MLRRQAEFGELLRQYRVAAGLTREELASRARLSPQGIGALERGDRRMPRKSTVMLLTEALHLSPAEQDQLIQVARQYRAPPAHLLPTPAGDDPILVGRSVEIAAVVKHLQHLDGESAPLLVVSGEPGIGKTRLMQEALPIARSLGWEIVQGACYQQNGLDPYAPFPEMLACTLSTHSPPRQRACLAGCSWLVRLLPELLDEHVVPAPAWNLPEDQERRLLFGAVGRLLRNMSGPAGTLLVLDDLQWAAADSLDLLAFLLRETARLPTPALRVIISYRDSDLAPDTPLSRLLLDLTREAVAHHLPLTSLGEPEAAMLLASVLGQPDGDEVARQAILRTTGGVPFFIISCGEELLAHPFADPAGALQWSHSWNATASLRQRVAKLSAQARYLLDIVIVAGGRIPHRVLSGAAKHLTPSSSSTFLEALDEAVRARLLVEQPNGLYGCAHDIIRERLAADVGIARTAELHRLIAEVMEGIATKSGSAAELAWHFTEAGLPEHALPYALLAGKQADARYANSETEGHYRKAAVLARQIGDMAGEAEALEYLSELLDRVERNKEAISAARQALPLRRTLGDVDQIAWTTMLLARATNRAERPEDGVRNLAGFLVSLAPEAFPSLSALSIDEMVTMLVSSPARERMSALAPRSVAAIGTAIGVHASDLGFFQEAMIASSWSVPYARQWGDPTMLATAQLHLGYHLARAGYVSQAIVASTEAAVLARDATDRWIPGNLWALGYALNFTALGYLAQGNLGLAEAAWHQALQASETVADVQGIVLALYGLSDVAFLRGDWEESLQYLETAAAKLRAAEHSSGKQLWLQARLGRLRLAMGMGEGGVAELEVVVADSNSPFRLILFAREALAEWDLVEGRPQKALSRLAEYATLTSQIDSRLTWLLPWALLECEEQEKAEERLSRAIAEARDQHLMTHLADILLMRALAHLRRQEWAEALHVIGEVHRIAQAIPHPYAELKAFRLSGQIAVAEGDLAKAGQCYASALAICRRLGEHLYRPTLTQALAALNS